MANRRTEISKDVDGSDWRLWPADSYSKVADQVFDLWEHRYSVGDDVSPQILAASSLSSRYPYLFDAYCLEYDLRSACGDDATAVIEKGFGKLMDLLPADFSWQDARMSYYVLDNRPVFRLAYRRVQTLQMAGHLKPALDWAMKFYRLCESDNLSFRDVILQLAVQLEEWQTLHDVCFEYLRDRPETTDPMPRFGAVLAASHQENVEDDIICDRLWPPHPGRGG